MSIEGARPVEDLRLEGGMATELGLHLEGGIATELGLPLEGDKVIELGLRFGREQSLGLAF